MILIKILASLLLVFSAFSAPALVDSNDNSNNDNNENTDYDMHELGKFMMDSHSSRFITEPLSHHASGSGLEIHENSMQLLLKREIATNKQHVENERIYQEHLITYSKLSKEQKRLHSKNQRRAAATGSTFRLSVVPGYWSAIVVSMSIGTPGQLIKMVLDFGATHTLVPSSSLCTSPATSNHLKREGNTTIHGNLEKRDVCHFSNGFDASSSSSVSRSPILVQDNDFAPVSKRDILVLEKRGRSTGKNDFNVQAMKDVFTLFAIAIADAALHITTAFFTYNTAPHTTSASSALPSSPLSQPDSHAPLGILAGAAPPLVTADDTAHWETHAGVWSWLGFPPPGAVDANSIAIMVCSPVNSGGNSDSDNDPTQLRKRDATCTPEVLGGRVNPDKMASAMIWVPVVPPPGFTYQSTFIIQMRSISIAPMSGTPLTTATIAVNPNSDRSASFGQVLLASWDSHILLTLDRVKLVYGALPPSLYRAPTSPNGLWLYKCSAQPIIRFELVDTNSKAQFLSMNPKDFYHGFSSDSMGWCNGAIQPLPTGATQQLIGLSYWRSFYTTQEYQAINGIPQAFSVGFAVSSRV